MKYLDKSTISKQIAFSAMFAALCCVSTMLLTVPLPASGYFNTGDVFVLLSGWFLGPILGCASAGIGSALADILSGYAFYAPATFVIKSIDALLAYFIWYIIKKLIKKDPIDFLPRLFSGIIAELFMIFGYFVFESIFYGVGGAIPNIIGNALQGACCITIAVMLCSALYPIKTIKRYFPLLTIQTI